MNTTGLIVFIVLLLLCAVLAKSSAVSTMSGRGRTPRPPEVILREDRQPKAPFKVTIEYFAPRVWHWKIKREDGRVFVGHASSMAYCTAQVEEALNK